VNCTDFGNRLGAYMEETLSADDRAAVDAHRSACPPCAELFRVAYEVSCREMAEFLDDYFEGRLPADRRAVFDRHLAICSDCESYLASYRRTVDLERDALCGETAPPVPPDLAAAILAARGKGRRTS
jgi:anti-sigma factor RsiW